MGNKSRGGTTETRSEVQNLNFQLASDAKLDGVTLIGNKGNTAVTVTDFGAINAAVGLAERSLEYAAEGVEIINRNSISSQEKVLDIANTAVAAAEETTNERLTKTVVVAGTVVVGLVAFAMMRKG